MGGGDLNSKKSWHPNTIKNQERVWKAEQAAATEKQRIMELQRERAEEMDRAELNEMVKRNAGSSTDNRLNWMYDKPDKKGHDEDYLLGKSIEKNYGQSERNEQDMIPAVARRVVGSSMLTSSGDSQVDLARKIREDPLLLVKERERAARAALLNNPLQRRRLADLLRKEQEQRKHKVKKNSKKKGKDLDEKLAAKLSALGAEKGVDIAKLLDSDSDSSSESDDKHSKKKKKKKQKVKEPKKSKKKTSSDSAESSSDEKFKQTKSKPSKDKYVNDKYFYGHKSESRKRKSEAEVSSDFCSKTNRDYSSKREPQIPYKKNRGKESSDDERYKMEKSIPEYHKKTDGEKRRKGGGLSAEEKAAKLAAMVAAGAEREVQRGRRVAEQRRADAAADAAAAARAPRSSNSKAEARALPDSLEKRIHSNRHYIQRDRRHMNENFARR